MKWKSVRTVELKKCCAWTVDCSIKNEEINWNNIHCIDVNMGISIWC